MYAIVLALHNTTRWLVLAFGMWALYRLATGWVGRRAWTDGDRRSVRWFALILSLQFVFGAVLYLFPGWFANAVLANVSIAAIMKDRILRFFTVEHPVQMIVAVGVSHMASAMTRRMTSDRRRFAVGTALVSLTMLLILAAIPWPFLDHGRPWFRLPW
jgi:hypothetical protein